MDVKKAYSTGSIVSIQSVGRGCAQASQHAPPYVRRFRNLQKDQERRKDPGRQERPPSNEDNDRPQAEGAGETEGFEITV